MFPARGRTDQRTGQLNVATREADVFTFLNLDALRGTQSAAVTPPRQRRNLAVAVALKFDSGFDRRRDCNSGSGEEAAVICRIQGPNVSGFIKRDELILPAELAPYLEIQEGILLAGV